MIGVLLMSYGCKSPMDNNQSSGNGIQPNDKILNIAADEAEKKVLFDLIQKFDALICEGATDRSIQECYEFNAQEKRMDLFEKRPYTIAFPYNGKFDLSMIDSVDQLSFITKKCGFQVAEQDTIINYYCLKASDSRYMEYLKRIQNESPLILSFYTTYQEKKSIDPEMIQGIVMGSEEFDFSKVGHRLFYMLFHLMVNEEQIAVRKTQAF